MLGVIIGLVAIVLGASALLRRGGPAAGSSRVSKILTGKPVGVFLVLIGGFMLMSTSFIFVDANSVGHLKRIYAFKELPQGRIIALEGEKGPQAQILGPRLPLHPVGSRYL